MFKRLGLAIKEKQKFQQQQDQQDNQNNQNYQNILFENLKINYIGGVFRHIKL